MKDFTSATAPRQGGKPGRKVKLSGQALQILERLMVDWMKHGAATLKVLRLERPDLYAKLALETAARLTLAEASMDDNEPTILVVQWRDPAKPIAPVVLPPEPPHRGPQTLPRLVSFTQPLDQ